jgi:cellulose synthase/poly-beta-1,6-N-acetylglucosamine synthase-like glycosyltransferase
VSVGDLVGGLLVALATFGVLLGTLPVFTGIYQYLLAGLSMLHTHLERTGASLPRIAILIPAWNEASVIAVTIDRLMALDYPIEKLRVYVIDDASTDATPQLTIEKSKEYRGRVIHLRRVAGGEGKAHTLNYGLDTLWRSPWAQAVLIMDADVIYTRSSVRQMARHLADPAVGAVTAYIKEGSRAPNLVQRFITFEYITATGASRRAQNVLGFLACLSGGAQLHSRENLLAIGGQIFSDTLAEDTFTTFRTQLRGRRAIFEPNAIVYAEEPDSLTGLWKQRVRWGRGNVQITSTFRRLWFDRRRHPTMGSRSMGMLWFSIFLMPLFQIGASVSLIALYYVDAPLSWWLFRGLWLSSAIAWLLVTVGSYVIDVESARKSWVEGILFPGIVSLSVISYSLCPGLEVLIPDALIPEAGSTTQSVLILFLYSWLALSMVVAWLAMAVEGTWAARLSLPLLIMGGYGAFLCAVTFASYVKELRGAARTWDKTVKTGKVG